LEAAGIKALGPSAAAARLEASKGFVKDLCAEKGIPTAAYRRCGDAQAARTVIHSRGVIRRNGATRPAAPAGA
jgi:phosphoribosylamine--glycine ligase